MERFKVQKQMSLFITSCLCTQPCFYIQTQERCSYVEVWDYTVVMHMDSKSDE